MSVKMLKAYRCVWVIRCVNFLSVCVGDGEVKVDLCALLWLEKQYFVC